MGFNELNYLQGLYMDLALSEIKKSKNGNSRELVKCVVCGERHKTLRKNKDGTYICMDCYRKGVQNENNS